VAQVLCPDPAVSSLQAGNGLLHSPSLGLSSIHRETTMQRCYTGAEWDTQEAERDTASSGMCAWGPQGTRERLFPQKYMADRSDIPVNGDCVWDPISVTSRVPKVSYNRPADRNFDTDRYLAELNRQRSPHLWLTV
jgi:hypothetical protein